MRRERLNVWLVIEPFSQYENGDKPTGEISNDAECENHCVLVAFVKASYSGSKLLTNESLIESGRLRENG